MFEKIDGQGPETFPTNTAEDHSQLPPTEENQIPAAESTKTELLINQPSTSKSTGPRSEIGKQRSSRNAIKSRLFARATLLPGECRAEYELLRQRLWKAKQPGDEYEELLLDMIVSNVWRQLRGLVAVNAETRLKSEFLEFDRRRREQAEAERISQGRQSGPMDMFASEPVDLISNIHNPFILERCIELLDELRLGIKTNGFDEEQDELLLQRIYGKTNNPQLRSALHDEYSTWLETSKAPEDERESEGYATPEQCKQNVLRAIGAEIKYLKQNHMYRESIESKRRKIEILLQRVPDSPGSDRFLRSQNSLEREFYRLLAQYERAQRIRKGQPLPPELDVKFA